MSNWFDEQLEVNKSVMQLLDDFALQHPADKREINELKRKLEKEKDNHSLLEIRDKIRSILNKKEQKLLKEREDYWQLINEIKAYDKSEMNLSCNENEQIYGFEFNIINGFYHLIIPKLYIKIDGAAPNKTENMMDIYIRNSIIQQIQSSENAKYIRRFAEFTIIFIHHFNPKNHDSFDTDNIEIKKPIDGINGLLIENDTIKRSHIFQITKPSASEYTEMYIVNGHDLSDLILEILAENSL